MKTGKSNKKCIQKNKLTRHFKSYPTWVFHEQSNNNM